MWLQHRCLQDSFIYLSRHLILYGCSAHICMIHSYTCVDTWYCVAAAQISAWFIHIPVQTTDIVAAVQMLFVTIQETNNNCPGTPRYYTTTLVLVLTQHNSHDIHRHLSCIWGVEKIHTFLFFLKDSLIYLVSGHWSSKYYQHFLQLNLIIVCISKFMLTEM